MKRYTIYGRLIPLSENGIPQPSFGSIVSEQSHDVCLASDAESLLLKLEAAIDQLAERDADLSLARHDYATLLERWREEQQHVLHWRTRTESAESRLGALQKAIEADLSDAKAVCGGDGEGCSAYRDYYDSAERRHRKCGTCPMDALFHVRAALNPSSTGDGERNG